MLQNWHNLEKSADIEKTEEDKCCLLFCCWTWSISSLFYPDTGIATFKISVNAAVPQLSPEREGHKPWNDQKMRNLGKE